MKRTHVYSKENYLTIQVNEPEKVLNFLTVWMGFVKTTDIQKKRKSTTTSNCITIRNSYGNQYLLPLGVDNSITSKTICNKTIIVNTDDCLRDYYNLRKAEEITFYSKPKYLPEGLAFEVSDKWGNGYILLENRNYTDN
jgi:hypothetical protein